MPIASTTLPKNSALPFLALLAGGVAVGFSPIFVRLSDLAPLASGFYRLALAIPLLWLVQAMMPEPEQRAPSTGMNDRPLLVLTGLIFGIDIVCWHMSLMYTSVADATLISNTAPIMVALGAFLLFGERMRPLFIVGLALAIAGVASLALQKTGGPEPANRLLGDIYAIGAAVSYAAYLLMVSRLRKRLPTARIVIYTTVISALVLLPLALVTSPTMLPATLYGWLILFGLAFVSHVGGQSFMTYALAHLPAAFSSMTQLTQAIVAAIAAWVILDEPFTAMKVASAAAILIGIVLCRRAGTAA
jgi:drug/metabolite transporter (DMT)-like permease